MRAGLSWHDSALVDVADARLILQVASGKAVAANTTKFVSLRKKTISPKKHKPPP